MTKRKPKALSDDDFLQSCRTLAEKAVVYQDSNLTHERQEVDDYYHARLPKPMREGGSKFVSQDVYTTVETTKTTIAEAYAAGSRIVTFSPLSAQDHNMAKHATAYCEMVVHRQNQGLLMFLSVIHSSLTGRMGVAKVYWDRREDVAVYTLTGVTQEEANVFLMDPSVTPLSIVPTPNDPTGTLMDIEYEKADDASQVSFDAIPPEEFVVSGRIRDLDKAKYVAHRYRTSLGELVAQGYDQKVVYAINCDDDLKNNQEAAEREQDQWAFDDDETDDEASRMVTVYESYIRIDKLGTGRQQLWKVVHCGDTLLEYERVAEHPFLIYVPQPLPHTIWGGNYASRIIGHANTKTTLTRAILDQAVDATNPRWQVARGGVMNPRELIENRRGGVVNVRNIADSIAPLPQQPMNPFVQATVQMIDGDREDTSGVSRLSQGLDKKALSHQNSQGLVEQLTQNSKGRAHMMARIFGIQFVAPLYLKIYRLALANERREVMLEVDGTFQPTLPSRWATRRYVTVDMTLGYGERDQRVAENADLHKALAGDPSMGRIYGEQQKYNLWRETLEIKGIKNIGQYLADPTQLPPPEPDPRMKAELAKLEKETEVMDRQQTLREHQVQAQITREAAEAQWKQVTSKHQMALNERQEARKDAETANRIDISLAELELAAFVQTTTSPENVKLTAIASPNS